MLRGPFNRRYGRCKMNAFKNLASCVAIVGVALLSQEALAQGVTGKAIRIVVPYAAGGPGDHKGRRWWSRTAQEQAP